MTALKFLTLLLRGQLTVVSSAPRELVDVNHERLEINATWNRATGEGRVITNVSRRVATELHADLTTVPSPTPSTEALTGHLGLVLYPSRGEA